MTMMYRVDDLAQPRYPWPIRTLNRVLAPFAGCVRLDENALLNSAMKKTGLTDFGDDWFREPLRVLVDALKREAELYTFARIITRQVLLQYLTTRLLVEDLVIRHPEILDLPVPSPIVITGLPRTGTTHLHNLLSRDPRIRSLPYWESLQPVLPLEKRPAPGKPDPRLRRCQQSLHLWNYVLPLYPLMHEMACEQPTEENELLAVNFSTMLFEWNYYVPHYRDWYRTHDQTPAYGYLRKLLQVLQWSRGGARWVLKSSQHREQLRPLLAVFPDAKIVQTHRDPVAVIASLCTLVAYEARAARERVDLLEVGQYWSARVMDLLRASERDRPLVPEAQILDVRFHEFMADNVAVVKRVYEFAEQPMTEDTLRAIQSFVAANPRGRLGRIEYHLGDFGLDPCELRQALRFYQERFDIPDE